MFSIKPLLTRFNLLDWFTAHRRITISIGVTILIVTILISVTRSNYISQWILDYFKDWSVALSAGAAVVLLYIIYMSVLQDRSMRRENRELDFKRRQLDGIVNWAKEVRKELFMPRLAELADFDLKAGLQNCALENEWAIMAAEVFGEEFQRIVEKAAKDLWAYVDALGKRSETTVDYRKALNQSFNKVLESAFKLKSEHKL